MKNKVISFLINGILAGIMLTIGCTVNMSVDIKPLGAFLFSLGLFAIIQFKMGLYTGKAGYMATNPPSYIPEVILTLIGNIFGTAIGGVLIRLTNKGTALSEKAMAIMSPKFADGAVSIFILAVFCGILMYTAVELNKQLCEKKNFTAALFAIVIPVTVFILCGFNHCVADLGYFFISGSNAYISAVRYFALAILGNAAGCMFLPFVKKFV